MKPCEGGTRGGTRRRSLPAFAGRFAAGLALVTCAVWGQQVYKIVTPDGKVVYTDKPPTHAQGSAQQLQPPQTGGTPAGVAGPAIAPMPVGPGVGSAPGVPLAPRGAPLGALQGTKEMNAVSECTRANAATLSLMAAAEELIRSVNNIKISGLKGASSYQSELLERQWKYYKSLGGTGAAPEQVRMPEDPCKEVKAALQRKSAAMEARYWECAESHPKEVKLSVLSKELIATRGYLTMLEKLREEKRNNPKFDSGFKGSGEWAAAFKADPALVRTELAVKFQEYRSAGGAASRPEDVSEIRDPCMPELAGPPRPSPITDKRTITLPRQ